MLNDSQIEFVHRTLGRKTTQIELNYLHENHGPDAGFFELDPRPVEGRKHLVLYTACTGVQIRDYLQRHRPEVFGMYQITHIFAHALSLRSAAVDFKLPEIVPAVFKIADAMIYNPVDAACAQLSDREIVRQVKPECKLASFGGPHQGCWWLICPFFGEEAVIHYLEAGFSAEAIWSKVLEEKFEPEFRRRFENNMAFLKGYQHGTDVRMTEFIADCYQKCKLFFTFNHPSCQLLAFVTDECLGQMGFERKGREHALTQVAADEKMVGEVYPETDYEWDYYGFEYPQRWSDRMGGIHFYHEVILGIEQRWKTAKK